MPKLKPLLKYPGGKTSELNRVFDYAPDNINNYIEPFVGGGAVYFATDAANYYINDISSDLMSLYRYVAEQNEELFEELNIIKNNWILLTDITNKGFDFFRSILESYKNKQIDDLELKQKIIEYVEGLENIDQPLFELENLRSELFKVQLIKNMDSMVKRIKRNEIKKAEMLADKDIKDNYECALKSSYYMYIRQLYNEYETYELSEPRKVAIYLFLREYCYSSMFRFNKNGGFNVPYGGISYNKKSLEVKLEYYGEPYLLKHLNETVFSELDFYEYVRGLDINRDDFMFLDPPYDTEFTEYDKNNFDMNDQQRLANYLINECPCKFMMIIKSTDRILGLYNNTGLRIVETDNNYYVSFKNRNEKSVKHLIIMNY